MQSMTGFGRGEASNEQYKIEIEMKSVNHRYLDINIRLPRALNYLEAFIKNKVKSFAGRGKQREKISQGISPISSHPSVRWSIRLPGALHRLYRSTGRESLKR